MRQLFLNCLVRTTYEFFCKKTPYKWVSMSLEYLPTTSYTLKWSTLFPLGKERPKGQTRNFLENFKKFWRWWICPKNQTLLSSHQCFFLWQIVVFSTLKSGNFGGKEALCKFHKFCYFLGKNPQFSIWQKLGKTKQNFLIPSPPSPPPPSLVSIR